jgi:hypothetical protein
VLAYKYNVSNVNKKYLKEIKSKKIEVYYKLKDLIVHVKYWRLEK